jgi:hypothetical protein
MAKIFIFSCVLISILNSCGLQYQPQTPPEDRQLQRQRVIESKIKSEFEPQKKTYRSIAFGKTTTIKPVSFIKLDSLFEQKYQLEQTGRKDRKLDEKIGIQRLVCQTDTNEILYMEEHVFSLETDTSAEVLSGNFALNIKNEIRQVEFTAAYTIPSNLVAFYGYYVLNESFMYFNEQAATEEDDFYKYYKNKAGTLFGYQKEQFIVNTLKLMKLARTNRSLEKQLFLRELTKTEVHGVSTNYENASFNKIDQFSTAKNEVDYYLVEYQFVERVSDIKTELRKYVLKFDPYLVLISREKI